MSGIGYLIICAEVVPTLVYIGWHWNTPDYYDVYNKDLVGGGQPKMLEMGWFTPEPSARIIGQELNTQPT